MKIKEIVFIIIINVVSNIISYVIQLAFGTPINTQVPIWLLFFAIGLVLSVVYLFILQWKVDPVLKITGELKTCIDDFEKFFRHPNWAIMPNPFDKEPKLWKYYVDSFSCVLFSWYSALRKRFTESKKSGGEIDQASLVEFSNEFCDIVTEYMRFAGTFVELTKTNPIPEHIRRQYNDRFVTDFNTIFRPNMIQYLRSVEKIAKCKMNCSSIESVAPIE